MKIFFYICILGGLFFAYESSRGLLLYLKANQKAPADSVAFHAVEGSWGRFYLEADFTYKGIKGKTRLSQVFMNQIYAEEKAKEFGNKQWIVYFDADNRDRATLEKQIPFRELVYALILLMCAISVRRRVHG